MPQPPPPPPPPPPLALDADRRALHDLGYLELTKVPDWELLAFCEMMHTSWHKRCAELLDGLRARWFEGCDEGARVGAVAARVATELLDEELFEAGGTHGIWISATHGSVDEKSWEFTGPRFYASVITAALRPHTGCCGEDGAAAARAPEGLTALLWPAAVHPSPHPAPTASTAPTAPTPPHRPRTHHPAALLCLTLHVSGRCRPTRRRRG